LSPLAAVGLGTAWASPLFLAILAAVLVICLWQLVAAALAGRPGLAAAIAGLVVLLSAPVWLNAVVKGEGILSYDRLTELRDLEDEFDGLPVEGSAEELPFDGPVLHHMELGDPDGGAGMPDCPEVVGLGLLALSNQLGVAAQDVAIVGVTAEGNAVAVPPDQARRLCAREWDWIEAVGRG